LYTAKSK